MSLRLVAVSFDVDDPAGVAAFWAELLGRQVVRDPSGVLLPGSDTQVGLRFVAADPTTSGPSRLHLHLSSTTAEDQQQIVETASGLGGRHIDVGQLPDEGHVVLADPAGEAFCVIEPRNNFLAGCGLLAEVSCEGSRQVGLFWRDALGWPLVWDNHGETAVQSPVGGTKVSWDGAPPQAPTGGRNRQRLEVVAPDVAAEVQRLVTLGASHLGDRNNAVELADPDGNEFTLGPEQQRKP
jgi:hypothetical protein